MKTSAHAPSLRRVAAWCAAIPAVLLAAAGPAIGQETDQQYCDRQEGPAKTACLRSLAAPASKPVAAPTASPTAAPAKPTTAATTATTPATTPTTDPAAGNLYKVVDGNHVDPQTLKGFQTWRAAACDRCHGPNQEGLVGPSLVNSLKTLTKAEFVATVSNGRLEKGMPSFSTNNQVVANIDNLYAYLKGRSDGAITKARVEPIAQ